MTKGIKLTKGKVALVDDVDFRNQFNLALRMRGNYTTAETPEEKRFGTDSQSNENTVIGEKPLFSPPFENKRGRKSQNNARENNTRALDDHVPDVGEEVNEEDVLVIVENALQNYLKEREIPPGTIAYREVFDSRYHIVSAILGRGEIK